MNLLPVPRSLELTGETVPARPARRSTNPSLPTEGYELRITTEGVDLVGADAAGLFYGQATLDQLARVHEGRLPVGLVRDHPDLPVRGVMLDVSRDKVPTMETLTGLVDRLARCKVNQVQLYLEHTFAYRDHPEVHATASPFTHEEILELDRFCGDRHVELVPNQNCLGHMNRWLAHPRYRPLAIAPDGFVDPFGMSRAAMTIDPCRPEAMTLIRGLLAELLPLFTSRRVHVGLDEAWELPAGRLDDYLAWVADLRALPELDGREMLMWGDMVTRPQLLDRLPEGVTVCEWGYDDTHPFDELGASLAGAGAPFWVAPGTSSWLSIVGRITNAVETCRRAAAAALAHGAAGFLNTDWGDQGHLQQAVVSEPAFAYGAAVSWCLETNAELDLGAALSTHVFDDRTGQLARAVLDLGDVHRLVAPQFPNMSALTSNLYYPQLPAGRSLTAGLTRDDLERVADRLAAARADAARSRPGRADGSLLVDEAIFGADLVGLLVRDETARLATDDGRIESVSQPVRASLADELEGLAGRYRDRWAARNRPGGLADSLAWLDNLRSAYLTGHTDPGWGGLPVEGRTA